MPKRHLLIVLIVLSCLLFSQDEFYPIDKLSKNLENAGENEIAILNVLESIGNPELRDAYSFLLAYMPAIDIVALEPNKYLEEVEVALFTRNSLPWGKDCPKEIFYNYVLPHRNSQEPLEYWRCFLLEQLSPAIDTVDNAYDAAIAINYWCGERVDFQQTQRQDQGVFETLKSGYGRCEEMAIMYVCACRACGIPARSAWTPYWTHSDNNHAWVEVYVNGKWHYTGGCEPKPKLNDAWFNKSVKHAPVVLTTCYGKPLIKDNVYKEKENWAIIYSTSNYGLNPGKIHIQTPEESLSVAISVYNWGAFRSILRQYTDEEGKATFEMNEGQYFISAGDSMVFDDAIVDVKSGQNSEVELKPEKIKYVKKSFDLKYR
ncbi:MAG: transglutaminase-like domain-containing protein [Candidatus Zixiibacteriota bacterium]